VADEGEALINLRLTGYWPYQSGLSISEQIMEGGITDRRSRRLITLEMWQADPENNPFVSCSGDFTAFPDGQLIMIPIGGQEVPCRVVDTGCNFYDGANSRCPGGQAVKVYRQDGYEPLDVCVQSSETSLPRLVQGRIIQYNNFDGGDIDASKFRGQSVAYGAFGVAAAAASMEGCDLSGSAVLLLLFVTLWLFIKAFEVKA
jgi:hypothetical protein